jgi:hypothetical protein
MSGEQGGQGPEDQDQGAGDKQEDKGFQPVTYKSQEELDAAFANRADRARREALKGLPEGKTLEDVLKTYNEAAAAEDAKKDELTREREARQAAEAKAQTYEQQQARAQLAGEVAANVKVADQPIPASLLRGNTKEELEASAAELKTYCEALLQIPQRRAPDYNPFQGGGQQGGGDQSPKLDPIRSYFETGSFA